MPRRSSVLLLLLLAPALRGEPRDVAAAAGPSVVRVHVSRSDAYAKAKHWGAAAKPAWPGQLGRFDAAAAIKRVPADAPDRDRVVRAIRAHDLSDPKHIPASYGSGLVLDAAGLVLTNAHVVKNATRVYVRVPGKGGSWADIWAADPRSDLAVLKLLDPPAGLKALPLGDGDKVRQGDKVVCLVNELPPGFPADDTAALSTGSISAVRQRLIGRSSEVERARHPLHHLGNLLQTTAGIAPGCSGGVLLDAQGKAVGLTSAIAAVRGEKRGTFAIPLDTNTKRVIEVLKRGEEVEYGFLGVVLGNEGGAANGVRLYRVSPGTPAERAGLIADDLVIRIDGKPVRHTDDLFLHIGMALAGNTARVVVVRNGRQLSFDVKLAKFYVPGEIIAAKRPPARFGLRVDWTSVLLVRAPFPMMRRLPSRGVAIREVVVGSPADKAKLQPDKIITHVDGKAVSTPAEYYREAAKAGEKVELTYLTADGRSQVLTLEEPAK